MESSNPFHPHSLLIKSNPNVAVASSMFIKSFFNPPPLRSSPFPILSILNRTPHLKIRASNLRMAEPKPNQTEQAQILYNANEGEKQEAEVETTSTPPPPEKPLPDDCCGSGCVRCVWDVYYDELEEYNKLYPQN